MESRPVMAEQIPTRRRLWPFMIITLALWFLHFLPFLAPRARLWGFNHLLFLPPVYTWLYLAGGPISLLLFFPPFRDRGIRVFDAAASRIFTGRSPIRWLFPALAALVVFWIGRLPVFLLGDSYSVIENIGNELPVIYKWSETGAVYLAYFVSRLLPVTGSALGEYAYALIAVISGAATVFLFCALASELTEDNLGRLFLFCLLICTGWIVLFFGYTENYSVLWPFMAGYIVFAIRYIKGRNRLLLPTVFLVLAVILHLQVLFFLISYPVLVLSRGRPAGMYARHRRLAWIVIAAVILAGAVLLAWQYPRSPELQLYLMPLLEGRPATPYYSLVSWAHILDILSQLLLLIPLLPLLVVLGWRGWRFLTGSAIDVFLLVLSLGGLVFLVAIDPKLGMARDWDLFALAGLGPLLLFAKNLAANEPPGRKIFPALSVAALVTAMPFVAANLSYQPAIDNYKSLLNLDLPKSRTGITILRNMYTAQGDTLTRDSLGEVLTATFPSVRLAPTAHALAEQGRYDEALVLVDSIARFDPTSVELYNLRGTIYLMQGDYIHALQDLEQAARLGRYDARVLLNLARVYYELGRYDDAMKALQDGRRRNPETPLLLEAFMLCYYSMNFNDSAVAYAQQVMQTRPAHPPAYFVAGAASLRLADTVSARIYLTRYRDLVSDTLQRRQAEELLEQLH